jgi:hypothetical protein
MPTPLFTMREALEREDLLGTILAGDSWKPWRVLLIGAAGERLSFWERRTFTKLTGRKREPNEPVDELIVAVGRRGGKSRASATKAIYLSTMVDYSDVRAPGESLRCVFLARDQRQAKVVFDYCLGIIEASPMLQEMMTNKTLDTISLSNGVDLEIKTASAAGIRGITAVAIIADEAAHWVTDAESANADTEILNAARPALATTGGPLIVISSPFARRGEFFDLFDKHYGPKGDPRILVAHGTSRDFNSSLPQSVVDRALARNPIAARAEYLAEFRSDLEGFVSLDTIRACTGPHAEFPPVAGLAYTAGLDLSSGSGEDPLGFALCHSNEEGDKAIVDLARDWVPPFSPTDVLRQVADVCHLYNIEVVIGDRFAYAFAREILWNYGIKFRVNDKTTSQCFSELAPLLNAQEVLLPQNPKLLSQLGSLERKPSSRGREWIGHPAGNHHDDIAAAVSIAVTNCELLKPKVKWSWDSIDLSGNAAMDEDFEAEMNRRAFVRTGNLDSAGRPIMPTSTIPIVSEETRRIGGNDYWLH